MSYLTPQQEAIVREYYGSNTLAFEAYMHARQQQPIIVDAVPWLDRTEEEHEALADAGQWMRTRAQLDDAARAIQTAWRKHNIVAALANIHIA